MFTCLLGRVVDFRDMVLRSKIYRGVIVKYDSQSNILPVFGSSPRRVSSRKLQSTIVLVSFLVSAVFVITLHSKKLRISLDATWSTAISTIGVFGNRQKDLGEVCPTLIAPQKLPLVTAANRHQSSSVLTPSQYLEMSCESIREHYVTNNSCITPEEKEMPLAFSLIIYRDFWQFERLLRAIYRDHHAYCVHLDLKAPQEMLLALRKLVTCFPNVHESPLRVAVNWATISQVDAELNCMRELHRRSDSWKYLINLTGHEFPLKTMEQLARILHALNGSNSVEAKTREIHTINRSRLEQLRPFIEQYKIRPVKGATHLVVVRGFVQYLLQNPVAIALHHSLRSASSPDETFFSTLNHNPQLSVPGSYLGEAENDALQYPYINRLKNWGDLPCNGFWRNGVCIWGVEDLPLMTDLSRKELFVNKLFWDYQPTTLDCLEWWHWQRTYEDLQRCEAKQPSSFSTDYYAQLQMTKMHH